MSCRGATQTDGMIATRDIPTGVSLQISVAPQDAAHARVILPHQLRQWGGQVDEVLFTLDLGPDGGRGRSGTERKRAEIEDLLGRLCDAHAPAHTVEVDYTGRAVQRVSRRFFAGKSVPRTDCYGKAVYPYFFGLLAAGNRYVLHLDSDMMFGGGSQTWVADAKWLLAERSEVFSCSPLPGPPSDRPFPRHVVRNHAVSRSRRARSAPPAPFELAGLAGPAFCFAQISTRDFMIDLSVFDAGSVAIPLRRASVRSLAATVLKGSLRRGDPRYAPAEAMLSRAMGRRGMIRVDFLGRPPGMWSLHPPTRSPTFYRLLPELVDRIEAGEVPDVQRGDYDLSEAMLDRGIERRWTQPR